MHMPVTGRRLTALLAFAAFFVPAMWPLPAPAAEIELATDAPRPLPPEESRKLFKLPAGFRVELVAAEPHLADPVAMAFDARGRIFVCEIHGYNLEGYFDIVELNETGELDKAVRRIPARSEAIRRAEEQQYGTVKLLEDTDGDGRVDRSTVLADRLPPCYGVVPARGGVIVLCAPDVIFLADRDGDGRAEVRETLFTGFGVGELWTRINNPRWLPDNWIYGVGGGGSDGVIRGEKLSGEVPIGSTCFRFKPDGSRFEPAGGRAHGFGQAVDAFGDRFLCTNQQHAMFVAPLPHRYLARNPFHAAPNLTLNISSYGRPARVYPRSRPDPWRAARAADPAWVRFYGAAEATANGYFTAASGQTIYGAAEFPEEFRGNHFSVDNAQNMIHRCLLAPEGAGYTARRPRADEREEFLTSTEQWFRPVNLLTGPDGALYVVDMYRDIIEDYSAIPRYLQQLYVKSLIAGAKHGRIWRIVAEESPPPRDFDLTREPIGRLVAELANPNYWWRMTVQRLLVERGDQAAIDPLESLARRATAASTRMHALYTLDGLDALRPELVEAALDDPHFAVRVHALRLSEGWLNPQGWLGQSAAVPQEAGKSGAPRRSATSHPNADVAKQLLPKLLTMVDDPHPRVRLQLALSLGQSRDPRATEGLSGLAARYGDQRWMPTAVLSSVPDSADRLLVAVLRRDAGADKAGALVRPLASVVGARHRSEEIGAVLGVLGQQSDQVTGLQTACLSGLIEGLERGRPQTLNSAAGVVGLRQLLTAENAQVQKLALRVAGLIRLDKAPEMRVAFAAARKTALDDLAPLERRLDAVSLLGGAAFEELGRACAQLLEARQPLDLQLAAVKALAKVDDPQVGPALLANFRSFTPQVQAAAIDAVFLRQNRLSALLDAIEQQTVPVASLDALRRAQLLDHFDPAIAGRAKSLLAGGGGRADRSEVLERYRAALSATRDAERGRTVFKDQCAKCHKLDGEGYEVGPDLATARTRADHTLVSDVMDPSNQLTVGYANYTVATDDGRIFTGVLAAETATAVTLRKEEGVDQTILRRNIEEMEASTLSMMPANLEEEVTPRELADLIAYLRRSLGPVGPGTISLFEDDAGLVRNLGEGGGTARLDTAGPFSGKASLAITPLQRYSARIPGWEYRIVEKPAPGEFRYLRYAWKCRGDGAMLELADGGAWPPGDRPLRRYYSGSNTTAWSAVRVAEGAPRDWVVVTRDLWKDFGPFTLTGIAPTAMGGEAWFDRIELLPSLDAVE